MSGASSNTDWAVHYVWTPWTVVPGPIAPAHYVSVSVSGVHALLTIIRILVNTDQSRLFKNAYYIL